MKYVLFQKRTRKEVEEKCRLLHYEESYIEEVLDYLEENEYIGDENYVKKYIANVKRVKQVSINEIRADLMRRGIDRDLIEKNVDQELEAYEATTAQILAQKKSKTMEKEKVKQLLLRKGYSFENVMKAIDNLEEVDDNE